MKNVSPFALKDVPALIQTVFPAQKVSFEAQTERKAGRGQTLTGLGSFWKGRKPLILVRAIILGSLLPSTGNDEKDLEIYEKLMAFDNQGLARRAFAQNELKPKDIAARISLSNPWDYFTFTGVSELEENDPLLSLECPFESDEKGIILRWGRDTSDEMKLQLFERALANFPTYEEKASYCKRPEEVDEHWLYAKIWPDINSHYAKWGVKAASFSEFVEQMGILRFGHRLRVGDAFSGGGSIPFEAARIGCDVYASDLNPIACMLTWGAFNVIGASPDQRSEIDWMQRKVAQAVDQEITALKIEHDEQGNRAKAYLYCLEALCPETGWLVPMAPSWVISRFKGVIAELVPVHAEKRFDIEIKTGVSAREIEQANSGTIQGDSLVYSVDGRSYKVPIKTIRGDYRNASGETVNRLRNVSTTLRQWHLDFRLDFPPLSLVG
jgi:putative DNA methylase